MIFSGVGCRLGFVVVSLVGMLRPDCMSDLFQALFALEPGNTRF